MAKVLILKGPPASGKSTFAKEYIKNNPKTKRVNKDLLRLMLDDSQHTSANEAFILTIRDNIISQALLKDYNVIIDDTNLQPKHEKRIRFLAGPDHEVEVIWFDVPLEVALERNAARTGVERIPDEAVRRLHKDYKKMRNKEIELYEFPKPFEPNPYHQKKCIIVDIDGTLAYMNGRGPYDFDKVDTDIVDETIRDIVKLYCRRFEEQIILLSGRDDSCREKTEQWLNNNKVYYDNLFMRKTGDMRPDWVVKSEIFNEEIRNKYNPIFVIDDRPQVCKMWRRMGLKVLQVGDPELDF